MAPSTGPITLKIFVHQQLRAVAELPNVAALAEYTEQLARSVSVHVETGQRDEGPPEAELAQGAPSPKNKTAQPKKRSKRRAARSSKPGMSIFDHNILTDISKGGESGVATQDLIDRYCNGDRRSLWDAMDRIKRAAKVRGIPLESLYTHQRNGKHHRYFGGPGLKEYLAHN